MQAFLVVDIRNEAIDPATRVCDVGERLAVDLFGFERLHEAFSLGVIEGIAWPAHADRDVTISQYLAIGDRGVLHAAIGVMDQAAALRVPGLDCLVQCRNGERGIESVFRRPSQRPCARRRRG